YTYTITALVNSLTLHDALPIFDAAAGGAAGGRDSCELETGTAGRQAAHVAGHAPRGGGARLRPGVRYLLQWPRAHPGRSDCRGRSEEHTSELQSRGHLVCRLLL